MLMGIREVEEPLRNKEQTGARMRWLVERFAGDLSRYYVKRKGRAVALDKLPLNEYFDVVRTIPYQQDTAPVEVVARPRILLDKARGGLDCKKKSLLVAAYCQRRGIPWRLVASSRRPDRKYHHVFPQGLFRQGGMSGEASRWVNLDATYASNRLGENKRVSAAVVLA